MIRHEDIDQADFSAALPISEHWKLLARYQYDFTNDYSSRRLAGLEYSSCCWAVRMVYQEGVDWDQGRDYGFYLEFVLRGLGGIGKNIDQLLQNSIFGLRQNTRGRRPCELNQLWREAGGALARRLCCAAGDGRRALAQTRPLERVVAIVDDDIVLASEYQDRLRQVSANLSGRRSRCRRRRCWRARCSTASSSSASSCRWAIAPA